MDGFGTGDDSVITTITGANGVWLIGGLPVGAGRDYRVSVPASLSGMTVTDVQANGGAANSNPAGLGIGIGAITLSGANTDLTTNNRIQDFGYRGSASLGDRIYIDADGDGVQDGNGREPSLPGVLVSLTWAGLDGDISTAADNITFTTTSTNPALPTDPNYLFRYLPSGDFTVSAPAGGGSGGVPDNMVLTDSENNGTLNANASVNTSLTAGEIEQTMDFGYQGDSSIGDLVWYDADGDGVQDAVEPGIPGVTVTLLWSGSDGAFGGGDDVTFTTTTDASGNYLFTSLPVNGASDPYRVTVTQPGSFPTQTFDSDGIGTSNQSTLNLLTGESNQLQDFGYRGTAQLGDFVWEDLNGNGRQDGGEPGINGVTVELFYAGADGIFQADELATPLLTTLTAGGGTYQFGSLAAGTYSVRFGNSDGTTTYTRTMLDSTVAADTADSDANVSTGFTGNYTVANGGVNNSVDEGLYRPVTLGDRVYFDFDGDGVQDGGEPGVPNVPVEVIWLGPDGVLGGTDDQTFTTTTGLDGIWSVSSLPPGSFQVTATPSGGSGYTLLTDSLDNGALSAINPVTISTDSGVNRSDVDFGFRSTGSLGDRVYIDADADGIQAGNGLEPGLPGVTVTLRYDANSDGDFSDSDDGLFTTVTDAAGTYLFAYLPPGSYQVSAPAGGGSGGVPDNMVLTDSENNGLLNAGATVTTTLTTGEDDLSMDFGYQGDSSIGDLVWYDADGDGLRDTTGTVEPGIPGVTVTLLWSGSDGVFGGGDDVTFTTTTDASGNYLFTSLPVNGASDPYRVTVTPLAFFPTQTFDSDGLATANRSDLELAPITNNLLQDFGYRGTTTSTAQLGDFVWEDLNGNGRQDGGEPGIDGVAVELFYAGADGVFQAGELVTPLLTTLTASDGRYLFDSLAAGTYRLHFGINDGTTTYTRSSQDSTGGF